MFKTESDYKNITALVNFAFANGMCKSQDEAKVLLIISQKCETALEAFVETAEIEDIDVYDISRSD